MANIYDFTDTWNDAGTTFTGIGLDVTDTASDANSRIINIKVNGSRMFDIRTNGIGWIGYGLEAQNSTFMGGNRLHLSSATYLGWTSAYNNASFANPDVGMIRDESGAIGMRVGTSPMTYRVYNTYTDGSNYERLSIGWATNTMTIGTEAAGTGTQRDLVFSSANRSPYIASPTAEEIRDILISFGLMAAS